SYIALNKLKAYGHPVVAIGKKTSRVNDIDIVTGMPQVNNVNTITLYLNPANQKPYLDYILSLKPERIIFNPGSENPELVSLAKQNGIATLEACTLVLLSTNQY
ncbi:MAG TPA: CoA-binding protein, partial [Ferruginibacter sp.]|nr:CoA-binding protein [Ferruginibacter sp.]